MKKYEVMNCIWSNSISNRFSELRDAVPKGTVTPNNRLCIYVLLLAPLSAVGLLTGVLSSPVAEVET